MHLLHGGTYFLEGLGKSQKAVTAENPGEARLPAGKAGFPVWKAQLAAGGTLGLQVPP